MLLQTLRAILDWGLTDDASPAVRREVGWTNAMGWVALAATVVFLPIHFASGSPVRGVLIALGGSAYAAAIGLSAARRTLSARVAILVGMNSTVLFTMLTDGSSLSWVAFIPVGAAAFVVVPHGRPMAAAVSTAISVLLAMICASGLLMPVSEAIGDAPHSPTSTAATLGVALLATPVLLFVLSRRVAAADAEQAKIRQSLTLEVERSRALAIELQAKSREAAAASAAKSIFLANMSHEIRTPLAAVISLTELARASTERADRDDYLDLVGSSASHLLAILNDVLDLSKVEAGQLELERAPWDTDRLLNEVIAMVRAPAEAKGLALHLNRELDGASWRSLDPVRLKQILLNLLGNALKFTPAGTLELSVHARGAEVTFEVRDTGVGMTPDQLDKVFQPFHQAERSTTRRFGGTGLGLTICKQLIDLWEGHLEVSSEVDVGTTVRFVLHLPPTAAPHEQDDGRTVKAPAETRSLRVLVAEDNPVNQLIIRRLLEGRGHEVTMVADGAAAVACGVADYDLVLMDLQMPVLDGLQATRRLRELEDQQGLPPTPIVALTANALVSDTRRCEEAGMDAHLTKPIDADALDQVLADASRLFGPDTEARIAGAACGAGRLRQAGLPAEIPSASRPPTPGRSRSGGSGPCLADGCPRRCSAPPTSQRGQPGS